MRVKPFKVQTNKHWIVSYYLLLISHYQLPCIQYNTLHDTQWYKEKPNVVILILIDLRAKIKHNYKHME